MLKLILAILTINQISAVGEVLGGSPVKKPDDFNFLANLFHKGKQACSGIRIHPNWVLSAAHCSIPNNEEYSIVFASNKTENTSELDESSGSEIVYKVLEQIKHPEYLLTEGNTFHDIMLIRLKPKDEGRTAEYKMTSLRLDEDEGTKAGDDVRFFGYGLLDSTYEKATKLHEVNLKLAEFDTCAKNWAQVPETLHPWQVCAGTRRQNACLGDFGAPLIKVGKSGNPNILVGINSFNAKCGRSDLPGVFTKVAYYKDFIRDTVLSREVVN